MVTAIIILCILAAAGIAVKLYLRKKTEEPVQVVSEEQKPKEETSEPVSNISEKPKPEHPLPDLTPKFKVGDLITNGSETHAVDEVRQVCYVLDNGEFLPINEQDEWQVVDVLDFEEYFNDVLLKAFSPVIKIKEGTLVYDYLLTLLKEGYSQYYDRKSTVGLPVLIDINLFPAVYNYYDKDGNEDAAFKTLMGWLFALVLAELMPKERTQLFKIGYELGGYTKDSNIYGYQFEFDPNNMRKVAAVIYAAMRGLTKPDVDKMREEVGGSKYSKKLNELRNSSKQKVGKDDFYIDSRQFMPTAPGPYAPGYETRSSIPYPNESHYPDHNLVMDRTIYDFVTSNFNLNSNNKTYYQNTVQAIADKEADVKHLLGDDVKAGVYEFYPVFGMETIGEHFSPDGNVAYFINEALWASSNARGILQSKTTSPKEYGRLRPGCSWSQEAVKHSTTDDRYNALANFIIEDGDNNPTGYYDKSGKWVYPDQVSSAQEYEDLQKNSLWANSYPSGHSAGITGAGMAMIEMYPMKADLILKTMNRYALNRVVARYHWTSDTINGMVLGSAQNAVAHAAKDYDELLQKAISGDAPVEDVVNVSLSYVCGGYGSCHVDAGEKSMYHYCNKECKTERHPTIKVSQRVNFTIEGAGVRTVDGKTSGVWEADKDYELVCPAVTEGEEETATITMKNDKGVRVLYYKLSRKGTHDDGPGK